jgi:folate-binding protein YgfZ
MFSLDPYTAAKQAAVLIDRSAQGKISLQGQDRKSFLHALLTNDIGRLVPGTGTYSAYLTPQGRMISDMRVLETGDQMLLDVEPGVAESLSQRLDTLLFSEDVQVKNVSAEFAELGVHGPAAAAVVEKAFGIPAARLQSFQQYDNIRPPRASMTLVRDDQFEVPGFDVYVPAGDKARVISTFTDAGAVIADEQIAETLRIEAGRPRFGVDMDTDTIPLEAGIEDRAISLTKGCYVGQEVIVRVLHRGHGRVARKLVWLDVAGDDMPDKQDAVAADGKNIGRITSAAFSPQRHAPLALGYVQREYLTDGTLVTVNSRGKSLEARVRQLHK